MGLRDSRRGYLSFNPLTIRRVIENRFLWSIYGSGKILNTKILACFNKQYSINSKIGIQQNFGNNGGGVYPVVMNIRNLFYFLSQGQGITKLVMSYGIKNVFP